MIPSALFHAALTRADGTAVEVRALEFAPDFFTLRLAAEEDPSFVAADLWFYDAGTARYAHTRTEDFRLRCSGKERYWTEYRFETADPVYRREAERVTRMYLAYIRLRLDGDEEELAAAFTHRRPDMHRTAGDLRLQECIWLREGEAPQSREGHPLGEGTQGRVPTEAVPCGEGTLGVCTLGLSLASPALWSAYLAADREHFLRTYMERHPEAPGLQRVAALPFRYIYLGSPFCPLLYPDEASMAALLEKAGREGVTPVPVFSTMSEDRIPVMKRRLAFLDAWCRAHGEELELEINDPGVFFLIREEGFAHFHLTAGVLPARRRKDPRLFLLPGADSMHVENTSMEDPLYREILPYERETIESCLYLPVITSRHAALRAPYYQMNTGTFCPLCAAERCGDRGKQQEITACTHICEKEAFLYPDALHMAGIGNSLFGFDPHAFDAAYLERAVRAGVDRLVLNFPGGELCTHREDGE